MLPLRLVSVGVPRAARPARARSVLARARLSCFRAHAFSSGDHVALAGLGRRPRSARKACAKGSGSLALLRWTNQSSRLKKRFAQT